MRDASSRSFNASKMRIGIVVSRYHREITDALLAGAKKSFRKAKGKTKNLKVVDSPGSWELTAICRAMAHARDRKWQRQFDAIVALGCILTGETTHDQFIAQSVTQGLTAITLETGMPIAFGVLTCQTIDQAKARKSKGVEAMQAAIAAVKAIEPFRAMSEDRIPF